MQSYRDQKRSGVGFVFTPDDSLVGVDLDNCRDPETGEIKEWAQQKITQVGSYTEVSPSGTGVKIFLEGKKTFTRSRVKIEDGQIEIYDIARYFTATGHHVEGTPRTVEERDEELAALCSEIFPRQEIAPAKFEGTITGMVM